MSDFISMFPREGSVVVVTLLRGVIYRDQDETTWSWLTRYINIIKEYLAVIGLQVYIDESEGYAFLRQGRDVSDGTDESLVSPSIAIPNLISRRQMTYIVSLLCVLLRQKLVENEAQSGEIRVIIDRSEIYNMGKVFIATRNDETKIDKQIKAALNVIEEYGFIRQLSTDENKYEVRRILKAIIDAEWLNDLDKRL